MSLFKNQDKMEKQLRNQLNGLEYKPSDSMWNRIEKEMRGDFEHSLEQKLRKFDATPDPTLWGKIEAELPIEKENNYSGRIIIGLLLLSLFGLSAYLVNLNIKLNKTSQQLASKAASQSSFSKDNVTSTTANIKVNNHKTVIVENKINQQIKTPSNNKHNSAFSAIINISKIRKISQNGARSSSESHHDNNSLAMIKKGLEITSNTIIVSNTVSEKPNVNQQAPSSQNNTFDLEVSQTSLPVLTKTVNETNTPITSAPPSLIDSSKNAPSSTSTIPPFVEQISSNKNIPNIDEDAPTNYSISIITGANLCFNRLVAPTNGNLNFDKNISLRNKLENPAIDWSGLFLLDYHINDRLHISCGVGILNFSQSFSYNTTTPLVVKSGNENRATIINPNDSIINGSTLSTRIKYSWTEIPIYITYQLTKNRRFNFELQGGLSYAFLSTVDAGMVNYDNVGVLLIKDKTAFPGLRNSFFVSLNPTITYNLNPTVTLGLMPTAKASLNSMIDNNNWVQQYPYFFGFSAILRKRF